MTRKAWAKPELEILNISMTEATTYTHPDHDEAYNGDATRRDPNDPNILVPHHES